jgi:hypothetical protein
MEAEKAPGRAYVVGAHLPNGGAYMAYRLGCMLELEFGWEGVAVSLPGTPVPSVHRYDVAFRSMTLAEMEQSITAHDILIANPSFSSHQFGLRLPGRKLMYIQGFSTYGVLDCFFDRYVAVSHFVADHVASLYGVSAPVIPAFIDVEAFPEPTSWFQRPAGSILVSTKGNDATLEWLRARIAREVPDIRLDDVLSAQPNAMPHKELIARLGSSRYLLTLSPAEGFGLIPLEAMAMGTVVLGFDGFGGREYMESGRNCLVTSYPDLEGVARSIIAALRDPMLSESLSHKARLTARDYTQARFQAAWLHELRAFVDGASSA